ncbi:MAG: PAS domain S-box protein [Lentisphaeria bacterium]
MRIRNWLLLVLVGLLAVVAAGFTVLLYEGQRRALVEGIDRELKTAALMARDLLPPDYHDRITGQESVSEAEYTRLVERFNRLCIEADLEYLWSLMLMDGRVVFTSATSPSKDAARGDHAKFLEVHANPELYTKAFATLQPQFQETTDKWGRIRAVLVPFRDARGRPCLMGASRSLERVDAQLQITLLSSLLWGGGVLLAGMLASTLLAVFLSRPIERVTRAAAQIAGGDLAATVPVGGIHELRRLGGSLNSMSQAIRDRINALAESQEQLRITLESIGDAVIATDTGGWVTWMNPAAEALTGWTHADAHGKALTEVFRILHADTRQPQENPAARVLQHDRAGGLAAPTLLVDRQGRERRIADSAAPIHNRAGAMVGVVLVFRDITEAHVREQALRHSEVRFSTLFAAMAEGVALQELVFDDQGRPVDYRLVEANPAFEKLTGFSREQARGALASQFYGTGAAPYLKRCAAVATTGRPRQFESHFPAQNKYFRISIFSPERNCFATVIEDITEPRRAAETLKATAERLERASIAGQAALWEWNLVSDTLEWSDAVDLMLGLSPGAFPRTLKAWEMQLHPDDHDRVMAALERPRQDPTASYDETYRIRKADGSYAWWHDFGTADRDPAGRITRMAGACVDVTKRCQAEEALRREQAFTQAIFDSMPGLLYLCDRQGRLLRWNRKHAELTGYSTAETAGRRIFDFFQAALPAPGQLQEAFQQILTDGEASVEATLTAKSGTRRLFYFNGVRIEFDGEPYLVGFGIDLTERKQMELALAAEKERLLVTLHSIGDGVITTDMHGAVTLMNTVAEQLTGWPLADAAGRPLDEVFSIIAGATREPRASPVHQVLATRRAADLANHTLLLSRDGTERLIADCAAPIFDREHAVIGAVLVFRDVTEKERLEQNLRNAQKLESLGVLAGGIAHDFNNLLSGMFGFLDLARHNCERGRPKEAAADLSSVLAAFSRAKDLTQQLLTFAKGGQPVRKPLSLAPIIRHAAQFALSGANVRLDLQLPDTLWPCNADENQLGQVIDNLVINARQAMPEGGTVTITAENLPDRPPPAANLPPGDYVCIRIRDNGPGISREHLPRIFDPFFTTKQEGSGLGLATVYSIMRKHDGQITAESELGRGSVFSLLLPAVESAAKTTPAPAADVTGHGAILVMDDEPFIHHICTRILETAGFTVTCTANGEEAVAAFRAAREASQPFALVILDLTVPGGKGGRDTIAELRRLDPQVLGIVSSGYADDPVMAHPQQYGFAGALPKPYTQAELLARVQSLLDRG